MLCSIAANTKIQGMKRREQLPPYLWATTSNQAQRWKPERAQCVVCLPQTGAWAESESLQQIGHQVLCLCYQTQNVDAINKQEEEKTVRHVRHMGWTLQRKLSPILNQFTWLKWEKMRNYILSQCVKCLYSAQCISVNLIKMNLRKLRTSKQKHKLWNQKLGSTWASYKAWLLLFWSHESDTDSFTHQRHPSSVSLDILAWGRCGGWIWVFCIHYSPLRSHVSAFQAETKRETKSLQLKSVVMINSQKKLINQISHRS